jgi:hypothetical protein
MSTHRETLFQMPSTQHCVDAITSLHKAFKARFQKNASVELFYSMGFSTDPEHVERADTHSVTLQADPAEALQGEIQWFREAALEMFA